MDAESHHLASQVGLAPQEGARKRWRGAALFVAEGGIQRRLGPAATICPTVAGHLCSLVTSNSTHSARPRVTAQSSQVSN